jgi:hypothetical protein
MYGYMIVSFSFLPFYLTCCTQKLSSIHVVSQIPEINTKRKRKRKRKRKAAAC